MRNYWISDHAHLIYYGNSKSLLLEDLGEKYCVTLIDEDFLFNVPKLNDISLEYFGYFDGLLIFSLGRGFLLFDTRTHSCRLQEDCARLCFRSETRTFSIIKKGTGQTLCLSDRENVELIGSELIHFNFYQGTHELQFLQLSTNQVVSTAYSRTVSNAGIEPCQWRSNGYYSVIEPKYCDGALILLKGGPHSYLKGGYSFLLKGLISSGKKVYIPHYPKDLTLECESLHWYNLFQIVQLALDKVAEDAKALNWNISILAHSFGCYLLPRLDTSRFSGRTIGINGVYSQESLQLLLPSEMTPPKTKVFHSKSFTHIQSIHDPLIPFNLVRKDLDKFPKSRLVSLDSDRHNIEQIELEKVLKILALHQ